MCASNPWVVCTALTLAACAPEMQFGATSGSPPVGPVDAGFVQPDAAPMPTYDAGGLVPMTPAGSEVCGNTIDEDFDGSFDEDCPCAPGEEMRSCYLGPAGTEGVGACVPGTQLCSAPDEFGQWGACDGATMPSEEVCDDGIDNNCNGQVDEGCIRPPIPEQCTQMTFTHVRGEQDCGPNRAVYMMDDGDGPNFICCPLPNTDILAFVDPIVRGAACGQDEVITGAVGRNNFKCTPINTSRYQLAAPQKPCYFGDGFGGAWGVSRCADHPHALTALQENYFGSDGCSGQPYGALFVSQSGRDCQDLRAAQLQFRGTIPGDPPGGTPVPMLP